MWITFRRQSGNLPELQTSHENAPWSLQRLLLKNPLRRLLLKQPRWTWIIKISYLLHVFVNSNVSILRILLQKTQSRFAPRWHALLFYFLYSFSALHLQRVTGSRRAPSLFKPRAPFIRGSAAASYRWQLLLDLDNNDVPIYGAFSKNSVDKKASILRLKVLLKTLLRTVKPGKVKKSISLFPNQKTGIAASTVSRPW